MGINIVQKILSAAAIEFRHSVIPIQSKKFLKKIFGMENF